MTSSPNKLQSFLRQMSDRFPDCWKEIDECRASLYKTVPDYLFVPLFICSQILTKIKGTGNFSRHDEFLFSALATWRATQGVYRFDDSLYEELVEMEIGALPAEVLKRLPEWCIYIELREDWAEGVFALIDINRFEELRLVIVPRDQSDIDGIVSVAIPLVGSLTEGLAVYKETEIDPHMAKTNRVSNFDTTGVRKGLSRIVSLVLYICSENADLNGNPKNPPPKKTKRGLRWFPPDRPKVWEVGYRVGPALKQSWKQSERDGEPGGASVRPHVRRAHYHHFWTGPQRKHLIVKWLHPIFVNVGSPEDLTTTIRPVP